MAQCEENIRQKKSEISVSVQKKMKRGRLKETEDMGFIEKNMSKLDNRA